MSTEEYKKSKINVAKDKSQALKATALIEFNQVHQNHGLSVEPEESQYIWHANILGWPAEKEAQKAVALELANLAHLEK